MDSDLENARLSTRLADSRARERPSTVVRGVNGYKWTKECAEKKSGRRSSIAEVFIPGPINCTATTYEEFWSVLFNDEMFGLIVDKTNTKIEDVCAEMMATDQEIQTYHHHTDIAEIKAYVGLLYYSSISKQSSLCYQWLWNKKGGVSIYRCVMSRARFMFLSACLRFDDKAVRDTTDRSGGKCKNSS